MAYAENTTVSVSKSRIEIEDLIRKHGAGQLVSGYSGKKIMIGFSANNRQVRFVMDIPYGKTDKQTEQLERQRWRAFWMGKGIGLYRSELGRLPSNTDELI